MNVNTLLEGASPLQHQQNEAAKLAGKWEKSGLLEGLNGHESEKANMAVLLENQARQLVNEVNTTGTGTTISAGGSEAWAGVALPLVRRVFGEIVAKDLLSVQPMNLPSGLIFYLDFQYGTNTGDTQPGFSAGDSLYAVDSTTLKETQLPGVGQNSGLYGAGRFGYSINETSSQFNETVSGVETASAEYGGILNFNTEFSASRRDASETFGGTEHTIVTLKVPHGSTSANGLLSECDLEGVRAFTVASSNISAFYPEFTRVNGTDVEFVIEKTTAAASLGNITVEYQKGPDNLDDRGDFEETDFDGIGSLDIPAIDVKLNSDTVTAKTRKLKAQWTPEFAQDLNAYHSIDAEAELTSILSEYISMEIDLELLDMLIRNADTTKRWSAKVGREVADTGTTTATAFDDTNTNQYYTKMSWFQTLGIKLQSVSNTIHQKTLRGGANFMVVSPKISTILESIPGFAADSPGDSNKYAMGVQKIGAINSRYTVYKNPYMQENTILMGYKGNQFLETGAVFAPYIPLIMTPLVYDPVSFTPRKGIMTRYAKKMVRPDFYGKVICADLDLV
tara:strand:- start:11461 stop:13152 length:1692 start_codon:yes stop_codon:yes gene_type:complete